MNQIQLFANLLAFGCINLVFNMLFIGIPVVGWYILFA